MFRLRTLFAVSLFSSALFFVGCGDDENESDKLGIGAQCTTNDQCNTDENQSCLTNFKGGYCSTPSGCTQSSDCPEGSACIAHDEGGTVTNYCFRICADKPDCNANRDAENESNCVGSVDFASGEKEGVKACVPPSGS